ncbi:spleen trypsin inhibitor I-like [Physeter macrocephalus]|uniref:Spleen trypsin inhibitor I-like n=1 Tax=Physeter macrocephalus TaxID=9755 RepID=A0A455C6S4_PHYMC|nr:spleen trypsin inhibitor I-like [Physeter catodon]|eukprot:XP_028355578.1 spleen trypsin inhibitor I-like [Physeter catodon]
MNRLCLSIALLVLLGTLVACTPGGETSNQAQASQPAFCLEPQYTGPCKAQKVRYFYNAKSGQCETFINSSCRGKKNNFLTAENCMKICGGHVGTYGGPANTTTPKL